MANFSNVIGSPSTISALSQDDSFFNYVIEDIQSNSESEKDLFEDCDTQVDNTNRILEFRNSEIGKKISAWW